MSIAYVGMGANIGDPAAQLEAAWRALGRIARTKALARSGWYRSAPVGYEDQPDFLNGVAKLDTGLDAQALLDELKKIEQDLGRKRSFRNAPRTIDLDLLLFGGQKIDTPNLTVPHPRMHERAFVLAPLVELEPELDLPGHGAAAALLRACNHQKVERIDA